MSRAQPLVHCVRAVNTASDSENRIHDDAEAAACGFRAGLVPGVTVYGYMTAPVLEHFGDGWMERGAMNVRFKEPVYDGEEILVVAEDAAEGRLAVSASDGRASGVAWMPEMGSAPPDLDLPSAPLPGRDQRPPASHAVLAPGTILGSVTTVLDLAAARLSAPAPAAIGPERMAHPAVLLGLANDLLIRNVVLGPWIHASSEVRNFSAAGDGDGLEVRGRILDQFEHKGHEFVRVAVQVSGKRGRVQEVIHTVIWRPRRCKAG